MNVIILKNNVQSLWYVLEKIEYTENNERVYVRRDNLEIHFQP